DLLSDTRIQGERRVSRHDEGGAGRQGVGRVEPQGALIEVGGAGVGALAGGGAQGQETLTALDEVHAPDVAVVGDAGCNAQVRLRGGGRDGDDQIVARAGLQGVASAAADVERLSGAQTAADQDAAGGDHVGPVQDQVGGGGGPGGDQQAIGGGI